MPQKVPGPNITFHHFRLMLEALRRADQIVSLGWSCPISDTNLLEAIRFQFWERSEPLKMVIGCWKYMNNLDQREFLSVRRKFQEMFPSLKARFSEEGMNPARLREIKNTMGQTYSYKLEYPDIREG